MLEYIPCYGGPAEHWGLLPATRLASREIHIEQNIKKRTGPALCVLCVTSYLEIRYIQLSLQLTYPCLGLSPSLFSCFVLYAPRVEKILIRNQTDFENLPRLMGKDPVRLCRHHQSRSTTCVHIIAPLLKKSRKFYK
jgi:hypothetical protein